MSKSVGKPIVVILTLIISLNLLSTIALAVDGLYFVSGNNLVRYMLEHEALMGNRTNINFHSAGLFEGYVVGVHDVLSFLALKQEITPEFVEDLLSNFEQNSKLTPQTTWAQINAMTVKYLKDNPKIWHNPAHILVTLALLEL